MILTDSEVASLKATIHCWEWFGYVSTTVVGLGCIGEFIAEFTSVSKNERWKHKVSRLSLIILIFGIAGELLSAVHTSNLSGELIANIEQKAGEANDRATANEAEAAQLRKDAEAEQLARVEIEESIAWRRLTKEKQSLIAFHLNRFKGQPASLWYNVGDREAEVFAFDIGEALQNAKWRVYSPAGKIDVSFPGNLFGTVPRTETGVTASIPETGIGKTSGQALLRELTALGFSTSILDPARRGKNRGTDIVVIFVEVRPFGPQGDAKLRHDKELKTMHK